MTGKPDLLARYQRIIEISADLVSTLNLDEQLEKIVHAAAELCDAEAASLLLYDSSKRSLFFQAATNLEKPLRLGIAVPMDSLAGWMVMNRKPVMIGEEGNPNLKKDERHYGEIVSGFTTRSLIGVPIMVKHRSFGQVEERVIGVVEVINKKDGSFEQEDLDLIIALGAQAAVAIDNTTLFQQSDLISEFVHELRAPLAALNNAAYLLQRAEKNLAETEKEQNIALSLELKDRAVQTIISEADYLTGLADDFLNLARLETGRAKFQSRLFDLPPLIQECTSMARPKIDEKGLVLEVNIQEKIPPLYGDRSKIKQVILNLISNSIKYTPEGGEIQLGAEAINDEMLISVKDSGKGIPQKLVERVFEKFYRVPGSEKMAGGTGLGLAICKSIVESHRGRIEISSRVPAGSWVGSKALIGTRVTVHLPLKRVAENPVFIHDGH